MQLAHILQQVESVWLYQLMAHFEYLHQFSSLALGSLNLGDL